jgi:nicotinamidase-related amidase
MSAQTLLSLSGVTPAIGNANNAALILIDAQEEYRSGALELDALDAALTNAARLLAHWRKSGGTVIHVVHHSAPGAAVFNPDSRLVDIMDEVAPVPGETIITKHVPNSFGNTNLHETLQKTATKNVVLAGFMTHLCVSTTARMAHQAGYGVTVASDASATRALPIPASVAALTPTTTPDIMPASTLHQAELIMLADIFAAIATTAQIIDAG